MTKTRQFIWPSPKYNHSRMILPSTAVRTADKAAFLATGEGATTWLVGAAARLSTCRIGPEPVGLPDPCPDPGGVEHWVRQGVDCDPRGTDQ